MTRWPSFATIARDHSRRLLAAAVTIVAVAGCTSAASPAPSPSSRDAALSPLEIASPSGSGSAAVPSTDPSSVAASASPVPMSGPTGGGLLLVYQIDGLTDAKTDTIYTLDVGTGEKHKLGTMAVTEANCCPGAVSWANDRTRAVLYSIGYQATVDVLSGRITSRPRAVPPFTLVVSPTDGRVAWVDDVTGISETIVLADHEGHDQTHLDLPSGAWMTNPLAWSPDGTELLATTMVPLTSASIELATFYCCSVDHGPSAAHLLALPIDGSPARDLASNEAELVADLAGVPAPPPAALGLSTSGPPERALVSGSWSVDGRSVAYVDSACWTDGLNKGLHDRKRGCVARLVTLDLTTAARRILTDGTMSIAGAPAWSPDGQRILFDGAPVGGTDGLYVVGRDGGDPIRLIDTGLHDVDHPAAWSPDGNWIVFDRLNPDHAQRTYGVDVWVMRANGDDPRLIAEHAAAGW